MPVGGDGQLDAGAAADAVIAQLQAEVVPLPVMETPWGPLMELCSTLAALVPPVSVSPVLLPTIVLWTI